MREHSFRQLFHHSGSRDAGRNNKLHRWTAAEFLDDLLVYLPDHGLVICKPCGFAVQPNALSSHLLRHQIYRDRRQKILDQVAELVLLQPAQVPLPTDIPEAFPHLPVASGYRCNLPGCDHLCISEKRMSQHLRDHHKYIGVTNIDNSSQLVYLQTFFRGNKLRYFQVKLHMNEDISNNSLSGPLQRQSVNLFSESNYHVSPSLPLAEPESLTTNEAPGSSLPMSHLMYLHHYTTVTALSMTRGAEPGTFWTHDLPLYASTKPFLMHGILGVAAFHRAVMTIDPDERRRHQSAGLSHQAAGLSEFRSLIDHPTRENSTALTAFARLLGVQTCAQTLLEAERNPPRMGDLNTSEISEVFEFLLLIRGGIEILLNMQDLLPLDSGLILPTEVLKSLQGLEFTAESLTGPAYRLANQLCARLVQTMGCPPFKFRLPSLKGVQQLMDLCVSATDGALPMTAPRVSSIAPELVSAVDDAQLISKTLTELLLPAEYTHQSTEKDYCTTPCPPLPCYPHIPAAIYAMLATLPSRLTAIMPYPHPPDLRAFNHAMAALTTSFSRSYAVDATWARWNGLESWTRMLPTHFFTMIKARNPLALVLVAHWCALLSVQEQYYWFLREHPRRMMLIIITHLSEDLQKLFDVDRLLWLVNDSSHSETMPCRGYETSEL
ncbi:hypothetical protein PV08_01649 [Exophiala spinifera]|uniref:C2H2-type domain-containing protein n=1 Tax=Exophiala spinifera TaxID=91928 RepID=A0A0D2BRQ0_9EURO|nr:uncharacterized protein PV08_01649 [Exophiala spinifera]KIW21070.1 hypothetical protein PV08_01649 [Exophiala spinifera]